MEARAALNAIVAADPLDARAWTDLGRLKLMLGDVGGASVTAGTAARLLDRAASGAGTPAAVFATDQDFVALSAGASSSPTDPTYALGVIRGLLVGGDAAGAVALAGALAAAGPGAPAAQLAHGDALVLAGRDPTAAYARAADLRFEEPAMLRLADAHARGGRARDAAATLALYLSQNPQSLTGQRLLGRLQLAAGGWAAAIETLEACAAASVTARRRCSPTWRSLMRGTAKATSRSATPAPPTRSSR